MRRRKIRESMDYSQLQQFPTVKGQGLYDAPLEQLGTESKEKVTISINASLLNAIDEHVHRTGVNRSAVFEEGEAEVIRREP